MTTWPPAMQLERYTEAQIMQMLKSAFPQSSHQPLILALHNCARRFWLHMLLDESGVAVTMAMPSGTCSALDQRRARHQNLRPQRRLRNIPQDEEPHSTETGRLQRDGAATIRLICGRRQQGAFTLYVSPEVLSSWTTISSLCLR